MSPSTTPPPLPDAPEVTLDAAAPAAPFVAAWGLTLYAGGGDAAGDRHGLDLVARYRPPLVGLHSDSGYLGIAAQRVRAVHPAARLWAGIGVDGPARDLRSGKNSDTQFIARLFAAATNAQRAGCEALVWDAEGVYEFPPQDPHRAVLDAAVRTVLRLVAEHCPRLVQGWTGQDVPTLHGRYDWSTWLGTDSPVVVALYQCYDGFNRRPGMPARTDAQLRDRVALSLHGRQIAQAHGALRADLATGPGAGLYLQAHDVSGEGTASVAREAVIHGQSVLLWPPATAEGDRAVALLSEPAA